MHRSISYTKPGDIFKLEPQSFQCAKLHISVLQSDNFLLAPTPEIMADRNKSPGSRWKYNP